MLSAFNNSIASVKAPATFASEARAGVICTGSHANFYIWNNSVDMEMSGAPAGAGHFRTMGIGRFNEGTTTSITELRNNIIRYARTDGSPIYKSHDQNLLSEGNVIWSPNGLAATIGSNRLLYNDYRALGYEQRGQFFDPKNSLLGRWDGNLDFTGGPVFGLQAVQRIPEVMFDRHGNLRSAWTYPGAHEQTAYPLTPPASVEDALLY